MTFLRIRALEQRIMLDAALVATGAEAAAASTEAPADQAHADASHDQTAALINDAAQAVPLTDAPTPADPAPAEPAAVEPTVLVVIDSRVSDAQTILDNLTEGARGIIIDASEDGIAAITDALKDSENISSIHIFAHGSSGDMVLGADHLTSESLTGSTAAEIQRWQGALTADADILLYACDVGAGTAGAQFVSSLADLTGADVAASDDVVGSPSAGGDWDFEVKTGAIEAATPLTQTALASIDTLAAPTVTDAQTSVRSILEDTLTDVDGITVGDSDGGNLTVTLTVDNGTLTISGAGATGSGTNTVTLSGTAGVINTALASLKYQGDAEFSGADTLTIEVSDGTTTTSKDVDLSVTSVNDAPNLTPPTSGSDVATVDEGGSAIVLAPENFGIDPTDLGAFDADLDGIQTTQQLTFEVTSIPADGQLFKDGAPLLAGSLFTLADLIDGKITYIHDGSQANDALFPGSQSDSFNVTIRDGASGVDTGTINIRINPVNQAPTVSGSATQTAYEGRDGVQISVDITDPDDDMTGPLTVEFGNLDLGGATDPGQLYLDKNLDGNYDAGTDQLITNGTVIAGITVAQLNAQLRLDVSNDEPTTPITFDITVTDGGGGTGTSATGTGTITVDPVENNDHSVLETNLGSDAGAPLAGADGAHIIQLTPDMLGIVDADTPDANLTYVVTGAIANMNSSGGTAQLQRGSEALGVGSTFTQKDIDDGVVYLVLIGGATAVHDFQFKFEVRDGEITAFSTVRQIEEPVEGGTRNPADTAYLEHEFNFRFVNPAGTGGSFSPAAPNELPVVSVVGISAGELDESGTVVIGSNGDAGPRIEITDTDNSPEEIIIRLEELPEGGTLLLNGQELALFDTFTQQDLMDGLVTYRHDGGEQFLSSNLGFKFSVSDGSLSAVTPIPDTDGNNFTVEAAPINDTPVIDQPATGTVIEGGTLTFNTGSGPVITITDEDGTGDAAPGDGFDDTYESDAGVDEVYVTITTGPANGKLYYNNVELHQGDQILKSQVESALFKYVHDGSETSADSFQLTVNDDQGLSGSAPHGDSQGNMVTVNIKIAPDNDTPEVDPSTPDDPTVPDTINTGLRVEEGGTGVIGGTGTVGAGIAFGASEDSSAIAQLISYDSDNNTNQIQYRITDNVDHGQLLLNGAVLGVGSTFTQADIDAGRVTYRHNGDEGAGVGVVADSFQYEVGDAGPGTYPTGKFDIEVWNNTNDAPTVTVPTSPVNIDNTTASGNPITGISVDDPDIEENNGDDFLQVIVRLTDANGNPLSSGDYADYTITSGTNPGESVAAGDEFEIDNTHDGSSDYLVLRGTAANVNAYLAGLQLGSSSDPDASLKLEVIVDDRARDLATGALDTSGDNANGGEQNQNPTAGGAPVAVSGDEFDAYTEKVSDHAAKDFNLISKTVDLQISTEDDPATVSGPGLQTVNEDVPTKITGITVGDSESTAFGIDITVTLTVGSGTLALASGGGVQVNGSGTDQLTLTGTAEDINALLAGGIDYTSASNDNIDHNGGADGDVTLTVTVNESVAAAIGQETTGTPAGDPGADSVSFDIPIAITPVNDAPVVNQAQTAPVTATSPTAPVAVGGFSVTDIDISGDSGGATSDETNFVQVTVRLLDNNGNPLSSAEYAGVTIDINGAVAEDGVAFEIDDTLNGTEAALQIRGTLENVNAALAALRVTLGDTLSNADHPYQVQVIADDRARDMSSGALESSGDDANGGEQNNVDGNTAVAVPTTGFDVYLDDVPSVFNLDTAERVIWPSSTNEAAVVDKTDTNVDVTEDARGFIGGDITIADTESDQFGLDVQVTIHVDSGKLSVGGTSAATGTTIDGVEIVSGDESGTLVLRGVAGDIEALLNDPTKGLFYTSANNVNSDQNGAADGDVTVQVTLNEYEAATTFGFDPADSEVTNSFVLTIAPRNDAPDFGTSTGVTTTINESTSSSTGAGPVQVVTGANVSDLDLTTTDGLDSTVFGAGSITVAIGSANAAEQLTIDPSAVPAGVSVSGGANGTNLVITLDADTTVEQVNDILEAIRYQTTSDTFSGTRTITITLSDGNNDQGADDAGGPGPLTDTLTATITVTEQNDPPAGTDNSVTTDEDDSYVFAAGDFGFSQPGGETDTFNGVRIDSLPTDGTLKLNGVDVTAGTVVTLADITGGKLSFVPDSNENDAGYATFTFSVRDSRGAFDTAPNTMTVNVNPVNDAPTFNDSTTATTANENAAPGTGVDPMQIVTRANIDDLDLATTDGLTSTVFGAGSITVSIADADAAEQLTVDLAALDGSLPAGMTISASDNGANGDNLVINFAAGTTITEVNQVLEALRYSTTSDTLGGTRTITITLSDGNNVDADGDNAGGPSPLTATLTATIAVTEQNDPPAGSDNTVTTDEDDPYVFTTGDFNFTQPGGETDTLGGVKIDTLPTNGTLLLDGVAVTAGQVITAADITAGKLTFAPDANENDPSAYTTFTFSVRDSRGALDTAPNTMTVNVNPANDAPDFGSSTTVTTASESAAPNTGVGPIQIVTDAQVGDLDLTTTGGLDPAVFGDGSITVAIGSANAAEQLFIDSAVTLPSGVSVSGGENGTSLVITLDADTTVAEVNTLLEAIRYETTSDAFTGTRTITITLNDGNNVQTGGNAGGPDPLTDTLTATVTITEQNDLPTAADETVTTDEDDPYVFTASDFNFTQPGDETDTLGGVRIDTLPTNGTLLLDGVAVTAGQVITAADITAGKLTFTPDANENDTTAYATFTFTVKDNRDGFATSSNTMTIDVNPVNDAPALGAGDTTVNLPIDAAGGTAVDAALMTGVTVEDIDLDTDGDVTSFGGGSITVSFTGGYENGDVLTVAGGILSGMSGAAVFDAGSGTLTIALADGATAAQVKTILEAIRYSSTAADLVPGSTPADRTFEIVLNDGNNNSDGGASDGNNDAGGPSALDSNVLSGTISFRQPPVAVDDVNSLPKTTPSVTGNVLTDGTDDSDPESQTITVTQVTGAGGSDTNPTGGFTVVGTHGTLTVNPDGSYTYTLNSNDPAVTGLQTGDPDLTDVFTYQISDTDDTTDTATLTITITGDNTAPVATDNANSVSHESSTPVTGNLVTDNDNHGVDKDPEGDTLTVIDVDGTDVSGGPGTITGTYGTLTVNPDGSYSYVVDTSNPAVAGLEAGAALTETFTYTVSDGNGGTATAQLVITVDGPDPVIDPPILPPVDPVDPTPKPPVVVDPPQPPLPPVITPDPIVPGGNADPDPNPPSVYDTIFTVLSDDRGGYLSWLNPVHLTVALQDRVLDGDTPQEFNLPQTAFQHTNPTEHIRIEATQPDGAPLPPFVQFDANTLKFTVDMAVAKALGIKSVDVMVSGEDSEGNEASTTFTIYIEEPTEGEAASVSSPDKRADVGDDAVSPPHNLQGQLETVGTAAFLAERDSLVADLKTIAA